MPKVVLSSSTDSPSASIVVRHEYRFGASTLHRRGCATSRRWRSVSVAPGYMVSGATSRATTVPSSSSTSVVTIVAVVTSDSFSTFVATATTAPSSSTAGVVIVTASSARCTGSPTIRCTGR